jgi:hypothetical protein
MKKVKEFIKNNKKKLAVGGAVLAAAGALYFTDLKYDAYNALDDLVESISLTPSMYLLPFTLLRVYSNSCRYHATRLILQKVIQMPLTRLMTHQSWMLRW